MALITPRAYWDNLVKRSSALLSASSSDPSFPVKRVVDNRRSKVWRSKLGWNIVAGVNDSIDFTESVSGAAVAVLTPGNYVTGADLAAEIEAAINAAATDNTYTVTYSAVTRKFTIARSVGVAGIDLNWSTGPNSADTAGEDIGFDVSADDTGATSYTSDVPVQMSSEWIEIDLLTPFSADAVIVLETNLTSSGTIRIQGNATNDFSAPSFDATLTGGDPDDPSKLLDFFAAAETHRFWRLFFEDRDNQQGFMQLGAVFLGPKTEFTRCYALNLPEARQELSTVVTGDHGAIYSDVRPTRREWAFAFRETDDSDKDKWENIANRVRVGDHLFYALDPLNKPLTHTVYGYVRQPGIGFEHIRTEGVSTTTFPAGHWNISFPFSEAVE